jgi:hypothetical protein
LFDGRTYNLEFDNACSELARNNDEDEIRATLCRIEWILAEAIRGSFFIGAFLQGTIVTIIMGWMIGFSELDVFARSLFIIFFVMFVFVNYWVLRFAFWCEVSRHIEARRFGA